MGERSAEWPDAWKDSEAAAQAVARLTPCACCGGRCISQLEGIEDRGRPYSMCSACDPALDEYRDDWLCECRAARGDANWVRAGDFERMLGVEVREVEEAWT